MEIKYFISDEMNLLYQHSQRAVITEILFKKKAK